MKLYRYPTGQQEVPRESVVALGNFDGLHRGHQVVIGEAGRIAQSKGSALTVMTTEPHPRSFFGRNTEAFRLTPFRERTWLMQEFGIDILGILKFDKALASTSAEDFVRRVLVDGFGAKHLVVGYDYRFGKGRTGDADLLIELGGTLGFGVTVIDPVKIGVEGAAGEIYSSSLVREALRAGQARRAAALLGHWWAVDGRVVLGDQRGRTIGFPTANVRFAESIVPAHGVYAVRAILDGDETRVLEGVANIGRRPTFGYGDVLLEPHLFDFDEEIYGRRLRVELVGFIRSERKFDGLDQLKGQIQVDCRTARGLLADPENARRHLLPPTLDAYLQRFPSPASA